MAVAFMALQDAATSDFRILRETILM